MALAPMQRASSACGSDSVSSLADAAPSLLPGPTVVPDRRVVAVDVAARHQRVDGLAGGVGVGRQVLGLAPAAASVLALEELLHACLGLADEDAQAERLLAFTLGMGGEPSPRFRAVQRHASSTFSPCDSI